MEILFLLGSIIFIIVGLFGPVAVLYRFQDGHWPWQEWPPKTVKKVLDKED